MRIDCRRDKISLILDVLDFPGKWLYWSGIGFPIDNSIVPIKLSAGEVGRLDIINKANFDVV